MKLSLFANDMMLHTENSKDATRKLELINKFSEVSGCKINTHKYVAFLYTNNKRSEKLKKQSNLLSLIKIIKYLVIHLPKEAKDLYSENYDTNERPWR